MKKTGFISNLKSVFALIILAFFGMSLGVAEPRPTTEDLDACYQRANPSQFIYKGHIAVALTRHLAAVIADSNLTLSPEDYVKFDPYLGLYLIDLETTEVAPYLKDETNAKNDMWVNVLEQNATEIGHIKDYAQNIGEFDTLSFKAPKKGILLCDCCQMLGIAVGGDKFIGNRYLRNFFSHRDVYYGDIGVNFDDINGTLMVRSVHPLGPGAKLMAGDKVVGLNGVQPRQLRELNEAVLFSPRGQTLRFEVMRNGKKQVLHVKMPYGRDSNGTWFDDFDRNRTIMPKGGNGPAKPRVDANATKADKNATETASVKKSAESAKKPAQSKYVSVLTGYGLSVDSNMVVRKAWGAAAKAGFEPGDKILQGGKTQAPNLATLGRLLSNYRLNHVLVSRDDFQFFIRLRR